MPKEVQKLKQALGLALDASMLISGVGEEVAEVRITNAINLRRGYLNAKFDRTGNSNNDITLRGYMQYVEKLQINTTKDTATFYSGDYNRKLAILFSFT